jgi:hypothetical protein
MKLLKLYAVGDEQSRGGLRQESGVQIPILVALCTIGLPPTRRQRPSPFLEAKPGPPSFVIEISVPAGAERCVNLPQNMELNVSLIHIKRRKSSLESFCDNDLSQSSLLHSVERAGMRCQVVKRNFKSHKYMSPLELVSHSCGWIRSPSCRVAIVPASLRPRVTSLEGISSTYRGTRAPKLEVFTAKLGSLVPAEKTCPNRHFSRFMTARLRPPAPSPRGFHGFWDACGPLPCIMLEGALVLAAWPLLSRLNRLPSPPALLDPLSGWLANLIITD